MTNWLTGSGGGKSGKGGSAPVEAPDSLKSLQLARLIDIYSEGEVEGLQGGLKGIYLNNTPIQNADGSLNFKGVSYTELKGTQIQDYIPGFSEEESEHGSDVGLPTEIKVSTGPITHTILERTLTGADAVRITIGVPTLTQVDTSSGNINGTSVAIRIDVQHNGGGFVTKVTDTIAGKTTSRYQRNYRIELPQSETGPWDIRITRLTPDSTSSALVNPTWWDSYTVITEAKMQFRNSAGVGIQLDSSVFSSIPVRGYRVKGLKVQIPTGYDPLERTYPALWDGTFTLAWTDNPVWCWYDLITSDRYGLGKYIDKNLIDKWGLYNIAQYCDELVPNGFGSFEPRFTCNLFLQSQEEAFTILSNMASIFRAAAYGSASGLSLVQDSPKDPIALYTPANVIGGEFTYSGASLKARHTVALVTWNDPANLYAQAIEYVPDDDAISKYGIIKTDVVAMGCTSRGQANRFGKAILLAEQLESEVVTFKTGLEGLKCYPGSVFNIADPGRSQVRNGGRLISATSSSVVIDAPVDLEAGVDHTLSVVLPDGSIGKSLVTTTGNGRETLQVQTPFSQIPLPMTLWVLESTTKPVESWSCLTVKEESDAVTYTVTAKAYNAGKFAEIDDARPIPAAPVYNAHTLSPSAFNLNAVVVLNATGSKDILVSWEQPKNTRGARITWIGTNDTSNSANVAGNSFSIPVTRDNTYLIGIVLFNPIGIPSPEASISVDTTTGRTLDTPTNLTQTFRDNLVVLKWSPVTDGPRAVFYEIRKGGNFVTALRMGTSLVNEFYVLGDDTYWVRAISSDGILVSDAISVIVTGSQITKNIVASFDEYSTGWLGTLSGTASKVSGYLDVSLGSGSYEIPAAHIVDVQYAQACRCLVAYNLVSGSNGVLFSTIPDVAAVSSFVGNYSDSVSAVVQIAVADNSGTFGAWQDYHPGSYFGRKFKFRINITSAAADVTAVLTAFAFTVDMPDRLESGTNVALPSGGSTITFSRDFQIVPSIQITVVSASPGDLIVLTAQTQHDFHIQITNGGVGVVRNINWSAQGY